MSVQIKTIAVTGEKQTRIMDLATPDLNPEEVLVRVHAVALCTLEKRIFLGEVKMPLPCTGGHEVSGEIAAAGPGVNAKRWPVGKRVAVRMLYSCGECHYCRTGRTNMCERAQKKPVREGLLIGPGGLCDYIIVKPQDLYPIADDITYEEAALTEPLACCVHSVEKADLRFGDTVVVIGAGIMGLNHVMLCKKKGCRVILSETDEKRRALAVRLGADIVINPLEQDPVQLVKSINDDCGADCVFNTTPIPAVLQQAIAVAGKAGEVINYSSMHPDMPVSVSPQRLHSEELVLAGSISPNEEDFYRANRLINYGIIDVKPFIAQTFGFEDAQNAFEQAIIPGTFRCIITN